MAGRKNCEIPRLSSDMSNSDSEDSDFEYAYSTGSSLSLTSDSYTKRTPKQEQKPVQRMPTRRPDPNVSNRNALLARENRRRKKAYVETLEKQLDDMKYTNRKLHKLLRKQLKIVKRLEHEKQYYKGLISNQSDILNLVSVLNTKVPAFLSKTASSCSPTDSNRSTSSVEAFTNNDYNNDNGSAPLLLGDPFLTEDFINDFNFFTDSNYEPYSETNWDELLGMDTTPLSSLAEENPCYKSNSTKCEVQTNIISGEHNYHTIESNLTEKEDSGLCLHIARGKISLEYCPSCHANAQRSNNTIPEQLLVVD